MAKNEDGPFAKLFMFIGLIAGAAAGAEANDFATMCVVAIIFAAIGYWVGRLADAVLAWVIFIGASIISLLINTAIRRFIWEVIRGAVGS
jgi:hypothetical protein